MNKFYDRILFRGFVVILELGIINHLAIAQIIPDRTLPNNSQVMQAGDAIVIDGGTSVGQNLFHSFQEFSVNQGTEAYFNNAVTIDNILTRITGGNLSNINGLIRANGTASLFLLNPNGIVLGPNARLQIGGSFVASTAEAIIFNNDRLFSATDTENSSLLTINMPIGLQFGETPGKIQVQGEENRIVYDENFRPLFGDRPVGIEISPNSTFALIGGEINFAGGNITTRGGRIELGSVAGNNTVTLVPVHNGWIADYTDVQNFTNIELSQGASVDGSGPRAGDIHIQGQSILLYEGAVVAANPLGDLESGDIIIKAVDSVILSGSSSFDFPSSILNEVDIGANSDGGFMLIDTGRLLLENGAVISVGTFGNGDGGQLLINARESVEMRGLTSSGVPTFLLNEANFEGTGSSRTLTIQTKRLIIEDGGSLSAGNANPVGRGGDIIIHASESVELSGINGFGTGSEIAIEGFDIATNSAGSILIYTNRLSVENHSQIGGKHSGSGDGGNVTIHANNIVLDDRGSITANTASGNGGNLTLNVSDGLLLRNQSQISTEAGGTGNGGNMMINADTIVALENSDIIANAFEGSGGQIQINTQGIFGTEFREFVTPESDITASSQFGVSGTVIINNSAVDPASGLVNLSTEVSDPDRDVYVGCAAAQDNSFTITGRGGIPANPTNPIQIQTIWRDLQDFSSSHTADNDSGRTIENSDRSMIDPKSEPIVEANSWQIHPNGTVELMAVVPDSRNPVSHPSSCEMR